MLHLIKQLSQGLHCRAQSGAQSASRAHFVKPQAPHYVLSTNENLVFSANISAADVASGYRDNQNQLHDISGPVKVGSGDVESPKTMVHSVIRVSLLFASLLVLVPHRTRTVQLRILASTVNVFGQTGPRSPRLYQHINPPGVSIIAPG